jgi:uncharacterized protein
VDIGVHQDGLVHISQLADRFIKDPGEVLKVNQRVTVTVREVDLARRRISLSMRTGEQAPKDSPEHSAQTKNDHSQKPKQARNERGQKPAPGPFNNPFAKALRK